MLAAGTHHLGIVAHAEQVLSACSETYEYYKLPYCKPKDGVRYKTLGMGEVSLAICRVRMHNCKAYNRLAGIY